MHLLRKWMMLKRDTYTWPWLIELIQSRVGRRIDNCEAESWDKVELSILQILVLVAITYQSLVWAEVENGSVWTAIDHGSVGTKQQMNISYSVFSRARIGWGNSSVLHPGIASAIDELVQQSSTMLRRIRVVRQLKLLVTFCISTGRVFFSF